MSRLSVAAALGLGLVVACDPLEIPTPIGAGPTDAGEGGAQVQNALIPPGALVGDPADILGVPIQTWGVTDAQGKMVELNWTMPLAAIEKMPPGTASDQTYHARLHPEVVRQTRFRGLSTTYLPAGHVPVGVYDIPHWESHVVYVSNEELAAIDCTDTRQPPDDQIPSGWILSTGPGSCIVGMGSHCIYLNAPEFNGARFTHSFSTGYYGGQLIAYEPKATVARLRNREAFTDVIPDMRYLGTAAEVYPLSFSARYVAAEDAYVYTLSNFQPGTRP